MSFNMTIDGKNLPIPNGSSPNPFFFLADTANYMTEGLYGIGFLFTFFVILFLSELRREFFDVALARISPVFVAVSTVFVILGNATNTILLPSYSPMLFTVMWAIGATLSYYRKTSK